MYGRNGNNSNVNDEGAIVVNDIKDIFGNAEEDFVDKI